LLCTPAISTGRRIGLSLHKREVAGSSPASGHQCRSSSGVERVNSQFVFYPSCFQAAAELRLSLTSAWLRVLYPLIISACAPEPVRYGPTPLGRRRARLHGEHRRACAAWCRPST